MPDDISHHHSHPASSNVEIHGSGEHGEHGGHATHGMLIVGEETIYLSHLPMFDMPEHHFQAIFEARFTDGVQDEAGGDGTQEAYRNDRRDSGERLYTLQPEEFFLPDLILPDPEHPRRKDFEAVIWRKHFERKGKKSLFSGRVHITNIVHFRQLDAEAEPLSELAYLLFGKGDELFLAHLITRPPDFDQVLPVKITDHTLSDEQLGQGLHVRVPERANTIRERLQAGDRVDAELQMGSGRDAPTIPVQLEAGREFYFEEGELRSPATFAPTEEEIRAGFGE